MGGGQGEKRTKIKKKKIEKQTNEDLRTFIFGISILKIESSCFFLWKENGNRGDNGNPDKTKTHVEMADCLGFHLDANFIANIIAIFFPLIPSTYS